MHDNPTGRRRGRPRKAQARYVVLDPDDPRLQGRPCRVWEESGLLIFYCARLADGTEGHMRDRLAAAMTVQLVGILDEGLFLQCWRDGDAGHWLELEERHLAEPAMLDRVRYERVPAGELPGDECQFLSLSLDGGFLWRVCEDDMSQELRDLLGTYVSMMLGDGLWVPGSGAGL